MRRGWYRPSLRLLIPVLDALLVFALYANVRRALGAEDFLALGALTDLGITCSLLAAAGGLRLTRAAAALATALSLWIFATLSIATVPFSARTGIALSVLFGTGFLSLWMTAIVRRAMHSEVGRATLRRFLPDEVIRAAYRDPLRLLTEPRSLDATVLVSDMRGFTAIAETLPPPLVLDFLNDVQGMLAGIVKAHGGTVDKFMGDGLLAVFGAPEPLPDHAARALAAARAMQAAIEARNAVRGPRGEPTVRLGIGVHTGPVVTGCLGSAGRLEFTVLGDTVNAASRLEHMTKEQGAAILATEETVRRAGAAGAGETRLIGELPIRGRKEPLRVHAVGPR